MAASDFTKVPLMLFAITQIIYILLGVAKTIIIVQAVLSWLLAFNVVSLNNDIFRAVWTTLDALTEPLYRPVRKIMPDFGALDLSPMVVLLGIIILEQAILPPVLMALQ
jgi:YggT family protein